MRARCVRAEEALRQALAEEPADWNFDTLVLIAQTLLDMHWPADVFDGSSGDPGPMFIARLREALAGVAAVPEENQ